MTILLFVYYSSQFAYSFASRGSPQVDRASLGASVSAVAQDAAAFFFFTRSFFRREIVDPKDDTAKWIEMIVFWINDMIKLMIFGDIDMVQQTVGSQKDKTYMCGPIGSTVCCFRFRTW